jgi:hypothetical protein
MPSENDNDASNFIIPAPGKYGNLTILPHAYPNFESTEELTWPMVPAYDEPPQFIPMPPGKYGTFTLLGPAEPGNPTEEELAWPIAPGEAMGRKKKPEPPPSEPEKDR